MTPNTDSPQARLVASRKALVRQMDHADGRHHEELPNPSDGSASASSTSRHDSGAISTWQVCRQAVMAWWQHHPVQVAVDIGRPFLNTYAREKPVQLLGIAAGVGALAVLVRPWRLISVTGLAVAAFKSSRLPSTLLTMLPRVMSRHHHQKPQPLAKDFP